MDWVHCNNCFTLPDAEKSFVLTSCGHIYCKDCERECVGGKCKLCGNQCTTIGLSSTMKPDVQMYFTDPDTLFKKKLKEVNQVTEFQKNHRARLMAHQRKQLKKFKTVKDDFRKLLNNLKELDKTRKELAQENDLLKKYLSSSFQKSHHGGHESSAHRKERSAKGITSPSSIQSVLTKIICNSDSSHCQIDRAQRISVISPPMNGKLGFIKATPSPSSAMQHLQLSSAARSLESSYKKINGELNTPMSTPGSHYKSYSSGFTTPQSVTSPYGTFSPISDSGTKYKKDVKKMVVHPFSQE